MKILLLTLIHFLLDHISESCEIFFIQEIYDHFIEDVRGVLKSVGYLLLEEEREVEGVLLAVDEFCDLSFVDGNDVVLVGGVDGVGLGVVEEGRTGLDAGGVRAEGIEKGLRIHSDYDY